MSGFYAAVRSLGCFVYFDRGLADRPQLVHAMLDVMIERFDLEQTLQVSVKNDHLRWLKRHRKAVDAALVNVSTREITWLVGTPADVRLGGSIELRPIPNFEKEFLPAPQAWLAAESERWPDATFLEVARPWLRMAAEQGATLSGGVLAASDLRDAKVEMTQTFETMPEDDRNNPTPFRMRMNDERSNRANWTKLRRVYPLTLLGPMFATHVTDDQLAAAGACDIERINGSVLFSTGTPLLPAWDPAYLTATQRLRQLLWPWMAQNPADAPAEPRPPGKPARNRH